MHVLYIVHTYLLCWCAVNGTAGEGLSQTIEERKEVLEQWVRVSGKRCAHSAVQGLVSLTCTHTVVYVYCMCVACIALV